MTSTSADEWNQSVVESTLTAYGYDAAQLRIEPLGNAGGLSGALLWRIHGNGQELCLRRWPLEHPSHERLRWIHRQMRRAVQAGCTFVPLPSTTIQGDTCVRWQDHLWELTTWLPGRADYHQCPTLARLTAAFQRLAQLHQALCGSQSEDENSTGPPKLSPGILDRAAQVQSLSERSLSELAARIDLSYGAEIAELCRQALIALPRTLVIARHQLDWARQISVTWQPCLRDIWHDHVLFLGDQVSGIIDFGAMRPDSPTCDLARLLGSMARDDRAAWHTALEAYQSLRPLSTDECRLIEAFDAANKVLSPLNWIRWIYVQRREFDPEAVRRRLVEITDRLGKH